MNDSTGWAVGYGGDIIKTTTGGTVGIQTISSEIPEHFYLSQNYPNPFNPVTKINYSIVKAQNVVLKVYDVLGSEVATLVNTKQNAGIYSVDWDAGRYPSGIYFYNLSAGDFTETRKMMLVK
ncbi:MAG: T9SS type A sorting domain-containing protein [Ignavibacteria bacterium]|nr:T9SS type A sorting domain-containing protein [Ignavibacteria bacterium]